MKKVLIAACLAFFVVQIQAQSIITKWDFESSPLIGGEDTPSPSTGAGTASFVGSMNTGLRNHGTETGCLQVTGTGAWSAEDANPGTEESSGAQFFVSTAGFQFITVQYDLRMSNSATRTERFQYSTDNGQTWENLDLNASNTIIACNGSFDNGRIDRGNTLGAANGDSWGRRAINLSALTTVNDNTQFGFRILAAHHANTGEFRTANNSATIASAGKWRFDNVTVSGATITSSPQLLVNPATINSFTQVLGTPSTEQILTINASNLTGNLTVEVPTHFEVSLTSGTDFASSVTLNAVSGAISNQNLFIRLNRNSLGNAGGDLEIYGGGISTFQMSLTGITIPAGSSQLFINEFMASNSTIIADEFSEFNDWIELYNPNNTAVSLAGYYLSDDATNPLKYQIPTNSTAAIPANGFLLIWADNQTEQGDLHTNFALGTAGEDLLLTAPDGQTLVDSYTFGAQTTDVSEGRSLDGAATWTFFTSPTPNASNNPLLTSEIIEENGLVYPNPFTDKLILKNFKEMAPHSTLMTMEGKIIGKFDSTELDGLSFLVSGTYFLVIESEGIFKTFIINKQ
jgi:hypothetical protein